MFLTICVYEYTYLYNNNVYVVRFIRGTWQIYNMLSYFILYKTYIRVYSLLHKFMVTIHIYRYPELWNKNICIVPFAWVFLLYFLQTRVHDNNTFSTNGWQANAEKSRFYFQNIRIYSVFFYIGISDFQHGNERFQIK